MNTTKQWLKRILPAMVLVVLGCNHEPPVAETPPVEVVISQPVSESIADWETYTGTVDSRDSVEVRARVRGEIKELLFKEGEEIEAGKLLYVIDDAPFQADLKQAKGQQVTWDAKLKAADEKIAIYKPLADKGTVAKDELVNAYSARGEALGGIDTAKGKVSEAEVNIGYCKIYSKIAGRIGEAVLTKGNIANAGASSDSLLTTVVSVDPLYVTFSVNEKSLLDYQKIMREQFERTKKEAPLAIPVEMALTVDTGYPHKGVVDFIDNKVDPATSSIKVRARFNNPKGPDGHRMLTPGLFARIRVTLADPKPAILVADRAILSDQSLKYVLVVNKAKKNVVERVDITASSRLQADGLKAVEAGLTGEQWVVVDGLNRVRPGVTVAATEVAMPRRPAAK